MNRERVKLHTLGKKIKNIRTEKGLTQIKLADELGVSLDTVKNWEQGYNYPSIDTLVQIADFFRCDFDYLLGKQEAPNKIYSHISEYTGLSNTASATLVTANESNEPIVEIVSALLEDKTLLQQIYFCSSANYGSVSTFIDIHDPFMPKHTHSTLISPQNIRQANSMELYNRLCKFIDNQRKKHGLPTSNEL